MGYGQRLKDHIWLNCTHTFGTQAYGTVCFTCACIVQSQMEKEANDDFAKLMESATPSAPPATSYATERHAACCVNCALKQLEPPVPSREELIELMCRELHVIPKVSVLGKFAEEVLDTLIKAGAVKP